MGGKEAHEMRICSLGDLPQGCSRGFSVSNGKGYTDLFLVRVGDAVHAYKNSCPHTGGPLDWVPDQFLNIDGDLIQCATHDALFRIEDGVCVRGPCAGQSLTALDVSIREDAVWITL